MATLHKRGRGRHNIRRWRHCGLLPGVFAGLRQCACAVPALRRAVETQQRLLSTTRPRRISIPWSTRPAGWHVGGTCPTHPRRRRPQDHQLLCTRPHRTLCSTSGPPRTGTRCRRRRGERTCRRQTGAMCDVISCTSREPVDCGGLWTSVAI